jgi:DNA-binding NtrC family response regulator
MNAKTVLIADDEMLKLMTLKESLKKAGYNVVTAQDGNAALDFLKTAKVHALITDVRMPGIDGLSLLEKSKELDPSRPVLVMTGYGAIEDAVQAMRLGATDYLAKPISSDEILVRLERAFAVSQINNENQNLRSELQRLKTSLEPLIVSEKMKSVFEKLARAAQTDATVLLIGETGVGKEICARYLHNQSRRSQGPFVVVSCAALAPSLVESELFGHEKGAFTGASTRREGRIFASNHGTLFLDDIDDIPLEVQTKLLRVLEDSTYERVGGTEKIQVDVRFVAATKRDLRELCAAKKFRDDLMYRLSVVQIEIPLLRERSEEIPLLAEHFLRAALVKVGRPFKRFTKEAMDKMAAYSWPGNVRELEHVIEGLVAIHQGEEIRAEDLPAQITACCKFPLFSLNIQDQDSVNLDEAILDFERAMLSWALERAQGNQARAAAMLKIPRSTFQYRLARVTSQNRKDIQQNEEPKTVEGAEEPK